MVLKSIYASNKENTKSFLKEGSNNKSSQKLGKHGEKNRNCSSKYTVEDIEDSIINKNPELDNAVASYKDNDIDLDLDVKSCDTSLDETFDNTRHRELVMQHQEKELLNTLTSFVVDTNLIVSHLDIMDALKQLCPIYYHQIIVPLTVIQELDGLKNSTNLNHKTGDKKSRKTIGSLARQANDWIYRNLANLDSSVICQRLRQTINQNCEKDDSILDCCLYFQENVGRFVVLLSNDKNLCLKALKEGIPTISFRNNMSAEMIACRSYDENMARFGSQAQMEGDVSMGIPIEDSQKNESNNPAKFLDISDKIYCEITEAVVDSVDFIMINEYGDELEIIGYSPCSLHNLIDVSKCFYKYWISIFTEYFKKSTFSQRTWRDRDKIPTDVPPDLATLDDFKIFWVQVLYNLFSMRTDDDNTKLQLLVDHWNYLIRISKGG